MGLFNKKKAEPTVFNDKNVSSAEGTPAAHTPAETPVAARSLNGSVPEHHDNVPVDALEKQPVTRLALMLGAIASIGGFMFGYESGQISGMYFINLLARTTSQQLSQIIV
jgi:SP family sugar:H+ symporter-like MFS transporter